MIRSRIRRPSPARPWLVAVLLLPLLPLVAFSASPTPPVPDDAQLADSGIRKLDSVHLTLYTDLPSSPEVDVLPKVFDQAFPQWCRYFGVDSVKHARWHVTACLIQDLQLFQQHGLIPDRLPAFQNGFSWNDRLWVHHQRTDYYQRHLLLHEGTHSFMNTLLGSCGPPWYMEGIADLLATHTWRDGRLTLNVMPASPQEAPMWGRIGPLQRAVAQGRGRPLAEVVDFGPNGRTDAESYAWCWALAAMLDTNPAYRRRFRRLPQWVNQPNFNARFSELFSPDRRDLFDQWQVFIAELEYGDDIARSAVQFKPGRPLPDDGASVTVAADHGWQSSGLRLEAGQSYQLRATGRYQLATKPQVWWCEPNGVSIRYYHGYPLGMLLAAVRPDHGAPGDPTPLLRPIPVGLGTSLTPDQTGTLYLRINDSSAELADNTGDLTVHVAADRPSPSHSQ